MVVCSSCWLVNGDRCLFHQHGSGERWRVEVRGHRIVDTTWQVSQCGTIHIPYDGTGDLLKMRSCSFFAGFLTFATIDLLLVLSAALLCNLVAPEAAGSGIPDVKAYLNGVDTPRMFAFKTLVVKVHLCALKALVVYLRFRINIGIMLVRPSCCIVVKLRVC